MPARRYRSVTIKDIAKELELSHQAVSHVLSGSKTGTIKVSEATRERIFTTAEKMSYRPSTVARTLRTGRSNMLGVLFPIGINQLSSRRVFEAVQAVATTPYTPLIQHAPSSDTELIMQACDIMLDARVDGVLLCCNLPDSVAKRMGMAHTPMVSIGPYAPEGVPRFCADRHGGIHAVTRHLIERGNKTLVLFCRSRGSSSGRNWHARETMNGFEAACMEATAAGMSHYIVDISIDDLEAKARQHGIHPLFASGYLKAKELIAGHQLPDAIVCQTDNDAQGVLRALREAGIRVPEDVAVSGFENDPTSSAGSTPLTSVEQRWTDLCGQAVLKLQSMIEGTRHIGPIEHTIPCELIVRQSTDIDRS